MTELTEPDHPTAQPAPEWPEAAGQDIGDPQVAEATARLLDLPGLPAAEHEPLYNALHDDLLAALNSDPAGINPAGSNESGGAA